jgi:hypothetical protein
MGDEGRREMPRHAREEEEEEEDPFEVVDEREAEAGLLEPVHEDGRADVGQEREDDDAGEEDLPRLEVKGVEDRGPDADEQPVGERHEGCDGDGVVGRDVGRDRDLGVERDVGPDKGVVEAGDGTLLEPLAERLEEELGAAVGVPEMQERGDDISSRCDGESLRARKTHFCQRFSSSSQVSETPSLKPPCE